MALPILFPIYPDPIPMLYQVSLSLPAIVPSEISLSVGSTASPFIPFLVPNVEFIDNFIKGDIGITDKAMQASTFKNINNPIAQNDEKVLKSFAKVSNFDLPDLNKYKKDGKIKIPKEEISLPKADGSGLKGFEKTVLTSIYESQKPYFIIAKLVIMNIVKIEDIVARVMPLLGVPLSTKSRKPVGNVGESNGKDIGRPKAIGYQNGKEIKVALAKLEKFSKMGSKIKINKDGSAEITKDPISATASVSGPGPSEDANGNKTWEVISTVYSTGVFKPDLEYKYIYIDLPPEKEDPEEIIDLNLGDDDPSNKYKPEKIILGIFRADGTPLDPNEKLKTVGLDSNYNINYVDTNFKRADWITRSPKWQMYNLYPNNQITLAEPVKSIWPFLGSPIFTWERLLGIEKENSKDKPPGDGWKIKKYKKGDKNLINNEEAIEDSPVIVGFDSTETSAHRSFFTDIIKYKMYQKPEVADFAEPPKIHTENSEKDKVASVILDNFNVPAHVENVYLYGQAKASIYKDVNGKKAFPDLMRVSFKPFRFYSADSKSDSKITAYNQTQNIPPGYIWIDPEADYDVKIIRIDPSTNIEFEEGKDEPEIRSNIKSFIKNKARFSISTGEKLNIEIKKNNLPIELSLPNKSFSDIDEYVLENWNYNSKVNLPPENRLENNNQYNISIWSKIPVRKYKNLNDRKVLNRELIGGNKIADFINGTNNLLLVHELINTNGIYYYRKYKWVINTSQILILGLLAVTAPAVLEIMVDTYIINPNAHYKFEINVGDFIENINELLDKAFDIFNKEINIKFTLLSIDYDWSFSIIGILDKIFDLIPGDNDAAAAVRAPIIKILREVKFSYDIKLSDFFPRKVYIPIDDGVQFLNDDFAGTGIGKTKTRIYLESGEVKKWYYIHDRNFTAGTNNDSLPNFGKDKKIIINYDSDPKTNSGADEGDLDIKSSSENIPLYKIRAENTDFPYGKVIDPSKITNDFLTTGELFSTGRYGPGGVENPQEIGVIKRYMLTDLDTESYYIIEGTLVDKKAKEGEVEVETAGSDSGYYRLPHAIGASKVFLSLMVDVATQLLPDMIKTISLFSNPAKFVTEILKEKMGDGFSMFSKESFAAFESAKKEKDKAGTSKKKYKRSVDTNTQNIPSLKIDELGKIGKSATGDKKLSEKSKDVKEIFKNSPISNHVYVDKKGDSKFLLDGVALLPFSIFGKDASFGMDMNFDKIPGGSPMNLIFKESLDKSKLKNIQDFLKPKTKDYKGTGSDGLASVLTSSELNSSKTESIKDKVKSNPNDIIPNTEEDLVKKKTSVESPSTSSANDINNLISESNNILQEPNESVDLEKSQKKLEELENALKKDPTNKSLKDARDKLKNKSKELDETEKLNSQPLLKMLLGFVTLPIKIIGGIIKWLLDFFKGLKNPLTLPSKIVELLSFSWLMKFFTPLGLLELAGIKFDPRKLVEWCAAVHVPNPTPPNTAPKIPDGYNLPTNLPYKDASPVGKFLIPDDHEIIDLNEIISMPHMVKLPIYTAKQYRENCVRPVNLILPTLCLFEKMINGIIDFIWSLLGIEALIPAPHIKLCSDSPNPDLSDLVKIKDDLEKKNNELTKDKNNEAGGGGGGSSNNDVPIGFLYDITLENGDIVKGLNYEQLQKYIKDNEDIGYDFKF